MLSSAFYLRERLPQILFLFQENAAILFPRKVQRLPPETYYINPVVKAHVKRLYRNAPPRVSRTNNDHLDLENFPEQLEELASDFDTFLHYLDEFLKGTEKAVSFSMESFGRNLKVYSG